MKIAYAAVAALVVTAATAAVAQEPALRLEALAERIAKLQAQIGQGVLADRSRRALPEAMREFDTALRNAVSRAASTEARENYLLLKLLWEDFKPWASKPPTRDNAKRMADRVEEVAWVAAKGARLTVEPGRKGTALLALDAAHAATLSQRVARLHLLRRWGLRDDAVTMGLAASSADLRGTLEKMRTSPHNTPEIETELQVAEGQLQFLLQAGQELEGGRGNLKQMEFIAKSGDHILASMERASRLYEGLAP
ncbi:MAG TPA: hypothetical protein VFD95_07040 [Usitatibacter sp.]|jgi:hypothetical protein|nr:hypothetical protein [Usitatibacter sp.]